MSEEENIMEEPKLSEEEEMEIWRNKAIEQQSMYAKYLSCRTWEKYKNDKNDLIHLQNKIGFILFGYPSKNDENGSNSSQMLNKENMNTEPHLDKHISPIFQENCNVGKFKEMLTYFIAELDVSKRSIVREYSENISETDKSASISEKLESFINLADIEKLFGLDLESVKITDFEEYLEENDSEDESVDDFEELSEITTYEGNVTFDTLETKTETTPSNDIEDDDPFIMYYSEPKQIEQIDALIESIRFCSGKNDELHIAFIFVIAKFGSSMVEFPVIRVRNTKDKTNCVLFVDSTSRCYNNWACFLEENCYPSCKYCYPRDGFYTLDDAREVKLDFGDSPQSKLSSIVKRAGDITSNVVGLSCCIIVGTSIFCSVAAPLLVATTVGGTISGLWSAGRGIGQLVDKKKHNGSLTDQDARSCWLNIATGVLGAASVGTMSYASKLARNGKIIGKSVNIVVNGVEVSSMGISVINIFNQVYNAYENQKITTNDIVGFTLSTLFFYHSAVKFKSAQTILKESQNEIIKGFEAQLSRNQRKTFRRIAKETTKRAPSVVEGNASVIKTIRNLDDPASYFKQLQKATKAANKTKSTMSFNKDGSGKLEINGKINFEPEILNSMHNKSIKKIFNSSKKFNQNNKIFKKDMKIISNKEKLLFRKNTFEFKRKLDSEIVHNKKVFSSVNSKHVKNIVEFLTVLKNENVFYRIIASIKNDFSESKMLIKFIEVINKIVEMYYDNDFEIRKKYNNLMNYYEENLKDDIEKIIEKIAEVIVVKWYESFKETNEFLKIHEFIIYMEVDNKNDFTPWNYFKKVWESLDMENSIPDRDSVVEMPKRIGWLFMLRDKLIHSIFIRVIRVSANVKKISSVVFKKSDPL